MQPYQYFLDFSEAEMSTHQWSRLQPQKKDYHTVVKINSWCHLIKLLHDQLCSSQLQKSFKQYVQLPKQEQKEKPDFKKAIKINTIVWNIHKFPQVKQYLFVF